MRIPEDIAVLGLGNFRVSEYSQPPLSSIPLPGETIGYTAFSLLDQKLDGRIELKEKVLIDPPPVIARESTIGRAGLDPITRALKFISSHACEGITVREVAEALSVSPQTLNILFSKKVGRGPGEEIRRCRLAAAKRFLKDPRLTIGEVAEKCGFTQHAKFSNFFRRESGVTPRAYRQQIFPSSKTRPSYQFENVLPEKTVVEGKAQERRP
jgi:LacI family transcriptional regulator